MFNSLTDHCAPDAGLWFMSQISGKGEAQSIHVVKGIGEAKAAIDHQCDQSVLRQGRFRVIGFLKAQETRC